MDSLPTLSQLMKNEQYMLSQFCHTLQAKITRLKNNDASLSESLASLESLLTSQLSWSDANRIELALVDFYDETTLITEWQRQLADVQRLPAHLADFYMAQATEGNSQTLRALLSRLVSDLQWAKESKRVIRFNEGKMRRNIVGVFLMSFVLFFSPTLLRALFGLEFDNLRLYYIFTAATSGIIGAGFSQLTSIQSRVQAANLDQVRAMSKLAYILARSMVGAGAGLVMFYLVQSGLLSGAFFPEFIHNVGDLNQFQEALGSIATQASVNLNGVTQKIESTLAIGTLAQPAQGLSLLIVWCFLAGFSEKMIPGILNNKAKKATSA